MWWYRCFLLGHIIRLWFRCFSTISGSEYGSRDFSESEVVPLERRTIPNTERPDRATHSIIGNNEIKEGNNPIKQGNNVIKEGIPTVNGKIAISMIDLLTLNVGTAVVDLTVISTKVF